MKLKSVSAVSFGNRSFDNALIEVRMLEEHYSRRAENELFL